MFQITDCNARQEQTICATPYFQFEKRFDFLFVHVMNMRDDLLRLPSWHRGKVRKLSSKSHDILLSDFCGNPVSGHDGLQIAPAALRLTPDCLNRQVTSLWLYL